MTSAERALETAEIESEAPLETADDDSHKGWPERGRVEFRGLEVSYGGRGGEGEERKVLDGVDLVAEPGQKVWTKNDGDFFQKKMFLSYKKLRNMEPVLF